MKMNVSKIIDPESGITEYHLLSPGSLEVVLISFGATLLSVKTPDRNGLLEEITLCHRSYGDLINATTWPYFGCVVGRVANRIANGRFSISGEDFQLAVNNGPNSLHGGIKGFDKKTWIGEEFMNESEVGVKLSCTSCDGEEGYPGDVSVQVIYSISACTGNQLKIAYSAETTKPTPINLTNHAYWNLSGNFQRKILNHRLQLSCSTYLPVNQSQIPTGDIAAVEGTTFDFSRSTLLSDSIPLIDGCGRAGIDHCFVKDLPGFKITDMEAGSASHSLSHVATLYDSVSGRELTLKTTQPAVQVYTANWLSPSEEDCPFTQYNAICLETQHFPDAINNPAFQSSSYLTTLLIPGDKYQHESVYSFTTR